MVRVTKRENRRRLAFEALEVRDLLAAFNVPWPEANSLTLSFAPDSTAVGNQASELFQTLGRSTSQAVWQEQILRAFQAWAVESNINIGLVSDGGEAFGTVGLKQGDLRFGDVRIGAFPMDSNVLAVADPYDPFVANTWVGDVFFNSRMGFASGDQTGPYDIYSVAVHEAGHVFGIGHSANPASPMYPQFRRASEASLTAEDIASLQSLYGARLPDQYDAAGDNGTISRATSLSLTAGEDSIDADITTLTDKDVYRFVTPDNAQAIEVKLEAAGMSLLVPHISIVDASGNVVSEATGSGPLSNDVSLSLRKLVPGQAYYIEVASGQSDVFGIGAYHLEVDAGGANAANDGGAPAVESTASATATASQLLATTPGYVEHTYYEIDSLLSSATPQRSFIVRSANLGPDMTNVMTVVLTAYDASSECTMAVFDDAGQPVAANVLYDAGGKLELQIPSVASDRDYRIEIGGDDLSSTPSEYELEVDFDQDGAHLQTFVNDTINDSKPEVVRTLQVAEGQQFHFALAASDWSNPVESRTQMTIADAEGRIVYSMSVADGATRSGDVFLNRGDYTVRFTSRRLPPGGLITFQLSGLTMSEPLGPQLRDTTLDPVEPPAREAINGLSFYWLPYGGQQPQLATPGFPADPAVGQLDQGRNRAPDKSAAGSAILLSNSTTAASTASSPVFRPPLRYHRPPQIREATAQISPAEQGESRSAWHQTRPETEKQPAVDGQGRPDEGAWRLATSRRDSGLTKAADAFLLQWKRESAAAAAGGQLNQPSPDRGDAQAGTHRADTAFSQSDRSENETAGLTVPENSAGDIDHRVAAFCAALFACLAWPVRRPKRLWESCEAAIDTAHMRWLKFRRLFRRDR